MTELINEINSFQELDYETEEAIKDILLWKSLRKMNSL